MTPRETDSPALPPAAAPAAGHLPRAILRFNLGLAVLVGYFAVLMAFLNVAFVFWIRADLAGVAPMDVLRAMRKGIPFDVAAVALVLAPAALFYFLFGATRSFILRQVLVAYVLTMTFFLPIAYSVSLQNFEETGKFMTYEPLQYLGLAWLPLIGGAFLLHPWLCTFTLLASTVLVVTTRWVLRRVLAAVVPVGGPRLYAALLALPVWLGLGFVANRGRLSGPPLNTGDSLVSPNPYLNAVCLNPVFAIIRGGCGPRDPRCMTVGEAEGVEMMRGLLALGGPPEDPTYPFLRSSPGTPAGNRMNVVLFLLESWSGCDIGCLGSQTHVTPVFDTLAQEGLLCTNAYGTGTRTAEGLFAVLCSFPNQPQRRVLHRPGFWHTQWRPLSRILAEAGYRNIFVHGRTLKFDDMDRFLWWVGFHVVIDRHGFPPTAVPINDSWPGYGDGEVMRRALDEFDTVRDRPFFGIIYTMNTHPPFVIPEGFPLAVAPKTPSDKFLNALHYSDHTVGEFMAEARRRPWFADTLFVFVADHSRGIYSRGPERFCLPDLHRIPLLFYSPDHVPAGRNGTVISQTDILPTVLHVLDLKARHASWGRDILAAPDLPGFAGCIVGDEIHWFGDGHLLVDSLAQAPPLLFDVRRDPQCLANIASSEPQEARVLQRRARAYLSLSQRLLYENRVYPADAPSPPPPVAAGRGVPRGP